MAIVVTAKNGQEVSAFNNNSMCATLYYSKEFSKNCAEYCGKAFEKTVEAGKTISYRCYAGLDCRAVPVRSGRKQMVAIVGRAFTRSETYRAATERAVTGDWRGMAPQDFFGNVLLTGSESKLLKVSGRLEDLEAVDAAALFESPKTAEVGNIPEAPALPVSVSEGEEVQVSAAVLPAIAAKASPEQKDIAAWRSLFGSMLGLEYRSALASILDFISGRYGFDSLVWLEETGGVFRGTLNRGDLTNRAVSLEIEPNDPQLLDAANGKEPLVISEERQAGTKRQRFMLTLFPLVVGGEVKSILGVGDAVPGGSAAEISRFCHSIASQVEILRLRHEVQRRDAVSRAVSKFNDALKRLDDSDFWQHLTRVSAELLQAERASLLTRREGSADLEIVGSIGLRKDLTPTREIGSRISLTTLERRSPILVANAQELALGPLESGVLYTSQSFISYPVTLAERGLAVLNLTEKAGGKPFDETDLEVLDAIMPQMAVAIDRVTYKEQAGTYAQLSVTDPLTGLFNRRYLETRMGEEILRSSRHDFPMSFLMLDVDEFKSYNDKFGHPAGDEALKLVGLILKDVVRGEDVAARYGGEEFSVLFPQTTLKEAQAVAERIRERVEETEFPYRRITVSIGLATYSPDLGSINQIIKAADLALYDAKNAGRNNVKSFGGFGGATDQVH